MISLNKNRANTTVTFRPVPPFDFAKTASYATYYQPRYAADYFDGTVFSRAVEMQGNFVSISVTSAGTTARPEISISVTTENGQADDRFTHAGVDTAVRVLGATQDIRQFHEMAAKDQYLGPVAAKLQGLHVPQTASLFEALVLAILGQQISAQVARILRTKLVDTLGPQVDIASGTVRAFPSPRSIADAGHARLVELGFGARKAEYVLGICERAETGRLNLMRILSTDDAAAAESGLLEIPGVGPWTAQWVLIRALGYPDAFPAGDLVLRKILTRLAGLDRLMTTEAATDFARGWAPYRSLVTAYLFAAIRAGHISRT